MINIRHTLKKIVGQQFVLVSQAALKKSKESISLIAGNYADDSETDEDAESPSPNAKKKNRQGVHVKVQKPTSKQAKPLLKEIPGIFKTNDDSDDENENINATGDNESDGKSDDQPPKKKGRWGNFFFCFVLIWY